MLLGLGLFIAIPAAPRSAGAQTDYYNTDRGRPLQTEDAYPIEYRAVEIQFAPLRLERARGGQYTWGVEPSIAAGLHPRTQFEIGFPLIFMDGAGHASASGLAGVELGVMHNLNVETRLPALALAAELHLALGALAPPRSYPSLTAIATKSFTALRVHSNARYTFGRERADADTEQEAAHADLSRWVAGVAIDRAFALRSLLVGAELIARQPLDSLAAVRWDVAAGIRHQLSPRVAADAGGGYRLTGDDRGWFATFGAAVAIGMPYRRR